MSATQKPKSRIGIVISFVIVVVLSLMFFVYALVQRAEAVKSEEQSRVWAQKADQLEKINLELTGRLEIAMKEAVLQRELAEKCLKDYQNSKHK